MQADGGGSLQLPALLCSAGLAPASAQMKLPSGPWASPFAGDVGGGDGVAPCWSRRRARAGARQARVSGRAAVALAAVLAARHGAAPQRGGVSTLPARAWGCPWLPTPRETTSPAGRSLRQSPCAGNPGAGGPAQVRRRARHAQAGPAPGAADRAALSQEHCGGGRVPTLRAAPCPAATASDVPRSPRHRPHRDEVGDGRAVPQPVPSGCPRLAPRLRNPAAPGRAVPAASDPPPHVPVAAPLTGPSRAGQEQLPPDSRAYLG